MAVAAASRWRTGAVALARLTCDVGAVRDVAAHDREAYWHAIDWLTDAVHELPSESWTGPMVQALRLRGHDGRPGEVWERAAIAWGSRS